MDSELGVDALDMRLYCGIGDEKLSADERPVTTVCKEYEHVGHTGVYSLPVGLSAVNSG